METPRQNNKFTQIPPSLQRKRLLAPGLVNNGGISLSVDELRVPRFFEETNHNEEDITEEVPFKLQPKKSKRSNTISLRQHGLLRYPEARRTYRNNGSGVISDIQFVALTVEQSSSNMLSNLQAPSLPSNAFIPIQHDD